MDFNNIIKHNILSRYENNELKLKKLIITPFIDIDNKRITDIPFRTHLIADIIAKYYRQQNKNVLFNVNCNNLNDKYVLNSKVEYNELNDNILYNYLALLDELNINYDYDRSIHLLDKSAISLYQNLFVYLFNNHLVKYDKGTVYYDPSYTYLSDSFTTNNFNHPKEEYHLFLDFSTHLDRIVDNINKLFLPLDIKNSLKNILGEGYKYKVNLLTCNDKEIVLDLPNPYMLGSLSCLLVGASTIDVLELINPSQISYLEGFFKVKQSIYFDIKNYITNPLTGKKIPIFICKNIKGYKGLFYNKEDNEILKLLNIEPIKIIDDNNLLINSDYLDGLTINSANETIINDFSSEGIIIQNKVYTNTKVLLDSDNKYGVIAPVTIEDNKMFLLSLKLPVYYDSRFNLNINSLFKIYDKPLNSSFIALFNYIVNIIYDKDREINSGFSSRMLDNIKNLMNSSLVIYNKANIGKEILLPIIMLSILEDTYSINLCDRIEFLMVSGSYDSYGYEFKETSNNLINYDSVLNLYNSDSLRLYLLSYNHQDSLYFSKDNIFKYKQLLYEIDMIINNLGDYNPEIDIEIIRLKEYIVDNICTYNFNNIIDSLIKFIKYLREKKPSKEQFIKLLVILILFVPNICNKINSLYYKDRIDLLSINWSKEI